MILRVLVRHSTYINKKLLFVHQIRSLANNNTIQAVQKKSNMLASQTESIIDRIQKSEEDKRLYRGLVLNNGMKILLISDPTTDKSSAAIDVHVGQMSDPPDLPGLAHFCEHMLFLGTSKFPLENEYNKFLNEHSGSSNAFTAADHTNYYFDVAPDHFAGALDRFAQFFLCPLFTESATDREVNAVNSEHEKNLQSDLWRLSQLEKSTADKSHAFAKFGTGNKKTLDEIPKSNGINVREELLKFHSQWYSSNIMALAVLGKESLDDLQDLVVNLFSGVTNKNIEIPEWTTHPFGEKELRKTITVVPVKDIRNLNITFPIPDLQQYYKTSPGHYLGHLIGHEGPGSLLSELKAKGWVNTLMGGLKTGAKGFGFFIVGVDLTEEGIDHVDDIVTHVFQYLNMLKRDLPEKWIFKECADLNSMTFRFKDKERPQTYTCALAGLLHMYPVQEVLCGPYLMTEYKEDLIMHILNMLVPEKIRVSVIGKKFEESAEKEETWYKTKHDIKDISEDVLDKWCNAGFNSNLTLPSPNEFIPTNFELIKFDEEVSALPTLLKNSALTRLWFKQDNEFLLPKAVINFEFVSPLTYLDPLHCNMAYMLVQLFRDALTEYTYAADLAGLSYNLTNTKYGMILSVKGYNDKQHVLVEKIMEKFTNFEINPKRFDILKEAYIRGLKNFHAEQPHQHAIYYTSVLLAETAWTKEELLESAEDLTLIRMQSFVAELLSKCHIEGLIHGNVNSKKALELTDIVEKKLFKKMKTKPLLQSQLVRDREIQLSNGSYYIYKNENSVHRSSCVVVYYQTGLQDTESNVILELFCQVIAEPCFNVLRTQEQLGYIVFSGVRRANGAQGVLVLIQSDRSPQYLDRRIEAFLLAMKTHIHDMDDEQFIKHKEALIARRLEKPKKLVHQTSKYWGEITSQQYNFDRDNIEVASLKTVTKDNVMSFYEKFISTESSARHKLAVEIVSTAVGGAGESINNEQDMPPADGMVILPRNLTEAITIQNITEFKSSHPLFPLVRPYINIASSSPTKAKL
uniref:Insulin-degrading enzyme n=1 Tax=Strigamia maritima TaxID=126957 RepID=T1ISN5_STRMM